MRYGDVTPLVGAFKLEGGKYIPAYKLRLEKPETRIFPKLPTVDEERVVGENPIIVWRPKTELQYTVVDSPARLSVTVITTNESSATAYFLNSTRRHGLAINSTKPLGAYMEDTDKNRLAVFYPGEIGQTVPDWQKLLKLKPRPMSL